MSFHHLRSEGVGIIRGGGQDSSRYLADLENRGGSGNLDLGAQEVFDIAHALESFRDGNVHRKFGGPTERDERGGDPSEGAQQLLIR